MKRVAAVFALLACVLMAPPSDAHTRSQSFSHWHIDGQAVAFTFAVDARRVTQLAQLYEPGEDLSGLLEKHLRETVFVVQGNAPCELTRLETPGFSRAVVTVSGRFSCPGTLARGDARASVTAFQAVSPTHIHIARVDNNGIVSEYVVREGRASFALQADRPATDLRGFIATGFAHVLSGFDHLVFLLALALVVSSPRTAILCVTGFTLGHSLALAAATLGWVTPNERFIESMIGFTIAITALEAGAHLGLNRRKAFRTFAGLTLFVALAPITNSDSVIAIGVALSVYAYATGQFSESQARTLLPVITTAFGLVHGAGFAGGLKEATLFRSELFMPLLGFNIGVELGQLCALAVFFSLPWIIGRRSSINMAAVTNYASVVIFGLGCFWFAQRLWL